MIHTNAVLEPSVIGTRVCKIGKTKLAYSPKSLETRRVDDLDRSPIKLDIPMHRITHNLHPPNKIIHYTLKVLSSPRQIDALIKLKTDKP